MKRTYQVASMVFILVSVYVAREALNLDYYTSLGPGPGFFPLWLAVLVALLSSIMLFQATFRQSEPMPEDFFASRIGYLRIGAITLAVMGSAVLMELLGFRLTMLAFSLFLLLALGRANPIATIAIALGSSFGLFYVFVNLLKVPLPIGMFGI